MPHSTTERDLAQFAALGFPAQVAPSDELRPAAVASGLRRVLEHPTARLARAAVLALEWLAANDELHRLTTSEWSDAARRRLGYLADRLAASERSSPTASRRLETLADDLSRPEFERAAPLTFTAATTPAFLEHLRELTDPAAQRWQVFSQLDIDSAGPQ